MLFPTEFILTEDYFTGHGYIPAGTHYFIRGAGAYYSDVILKNGLEYTANISHSLLSRFIIKPCTLEKFLKLKAFT